MKNPKILVVGDADRKTAGCVTWWRLSGEVDHAAFVAAFLSDGFNESELPVSSSPASALKRACDELKGPNTLIRSAPRGGWAIVDESENGEHLLYTERVQVRLTGNGETDIEFFGGDLPLRRLLVQHYEHHLCTLTPSDVSSWLIRVLDSMQAIVLRDTGGIYFVPQMGVHLWEQVDRVLRSVSAHVIFEMPALQSDRALEALLDAVKREAEMFAADAQADIGAGDLGVRALNTRKERCDAMAMKIGTYEHLLGVKMEELRAALETVQARATAAIMLAEEQSDGAR